MADSKTSSYSIIVKLTDDVTKPLRAINKELIAAQAPFKRFSGEFAKFSKLSGLDKISTGFKNMTGHVTKALSGIIRMIPALGALTGLASLAGIAQLVRHWADFGTSLLNTSALIGTTVTNLQSLQNAARLAGVSADAMTSSLDGIGRAAQDALSGRDGSAAALFQRWGIGIQKSGYQAKAGADLIMQEFDAIKRASEQGMSAANIQRMASIWHIDPSLIPMAEREGSAGLRRQQAVAKHYGVFSDAGAKNAYQLRQSFTELELSVEGFGNTLSETVAPAVSDILHDMAEWIRDNKAWIAADIGKYLKEFVTWLRGGHPFLKAWRDGILDIVHALGGWKVGLEAVIGIWAGWKIAKTILGIFRIVAAVRALSAALRGVKVGEGLTTLLRGGAPAAKAGAAAAGEGATAGEAAAGGGLFGWIGKGLAGLGGMLATGIGSTLGIGAGVGAVGEGAAYALGKKGYSIPYVDPNTGVPTYLPNSQTDDTGHLKKMNFSPDQWNAFSGSVATIEHARYNQMGGAGGSYAGKYQMGRTEITETAARLKESSPTTKQFLADPAMQERFFKAYTEGHYAQLMRNPKFAAMSPEQQAEVLAYAHNQGAGGANKFINTGQVGHDAFGTAGTAYGNLVRQNWPQDGRPDSIAATIARLKQQIAKPSAQQVSMAGPGALNGGLQVTINAPAGYPTSAKASGNVISGAPRIVQPMSSYALA